MCLGVLQTSFCIIVVDFWIYKTVTDTELPNIYASKGVNIFYVTLWPFCIFFYLGILSVIVTAEL